MTKYDKMRDLLCAGINEVVDRRLIDLHDQEDVTGEIYIDLFDRPSKISWNGWGYGELRFTVWWNIKPELLDSRSRLPENEPLSKGLDIACSGFLERKDGLWIQGMGKRGLLDTYCARHAEGDLFAIPAIDGREFGRDYRSRKLRKLAA